MAFSPESTTDNPVIFDVGFLITTPIYKVLAAHDKINDFCAGLNSLGIFLAFPYVLKTTFWSADYTLAFRIIATQLFRAFCGFFTFLPPSNEFLPSYWDYPEAIYCVAGTVDCSVPPDRNDPLSFVTFFSGHVAMTVIIGNHMYTRGFTKCGILMHVLNMLQILRLLATRGHYSIDLIIGWVVAVYVSNPAERMGRYFSRGTSESFALFSFGEVTLTNLFEGVAGIKDVREGGGYEFTRMTSTDGMSSLKLGSSLANDAARDAYTQIEAQLADAQEKATRQLAKVGVEEMKEKFGRLNREEMYRALSAAINAEEMKERFRNVAK
eukprot:CAMPEP_0118632992 /NCGR_PEP_ID=MMETSP0785-20121206/747_1 /TAXON_ID=91992 /ORGANISM="Bolidomonas pacifica, Strain CCMP 1866" /LENGTH=323 /DNA_ID=CAMNT_0006523813 /DNA_START=151 /DNA_END=1119 /DNA_ORIENTATION=-